MKQTHRIIPKCRGCGGEAFSASGATNSRGGRPTAHLRCLGCGRERDSVARFARDAAKEADKRGVAVIVDREGVRGA